MTGSKSRSALEAERERSERGTGVKAEHYDTVSMLFADFVGLIERSLIMAADELAALLDKIFSAFDRLADAEGVEKIKTIGDAYMVAAGCRSYVRTTSRRSPHGARDA